MKIKNDIYSIKCTYLQNGKENTWEGIIKLELEQYLSGNGSIYFVEGAIIDNADIARKQRYVFAPAGLDQVKGLLRFVIFPPNMQPIEYRLNYGEEDECFYGTWRFLYSGENEPDYPRFAKIELEPNFQTDKVEVIRTIDLAEHNACGLLYMSEMTDKQSPTILSDDFFPEESYAAAKKHFRGHSKTKEC